MKLSRRKSFSPIGVDVDGRSIAAVQLSLTGEGFQIEAATVLGRIGSQFPPEQPELHRLSEVLARQGFQGKKLVLGVPSDQVLASMLDLPPAGSGAPLEQIARIELARIHKCEPADLELAMWNLPPRQRASGGVIENRSGTHVAYT